MYYNAKEKCKQKIDDLSKEIISLSDELFKTNFGKNTSNEQLMLNHGFVEIFHAVRSGIGSQLPVIAQTAEGLVHDSGHRSQ